MAHLLKKLPFAENSLEPLISKETVALHYRKHHQGYIDKLNKLVVGTPFEHQSLTETLLRAGGEVFNNAAQAWNHDFYWQSLTPNPRSPEGPLLQAIQNTFSSVEVFKKDFLAAALGLFGSGWAWLVMDREGFLSIETTSNAGNPLRMGKTPLLVVDVWEHAYYLDYRNERARYLEAIHSALNWEFAEAGYGHFEERLSGAV